MCGAQNASLASVWFTPEGKPEANIESVKKAYDIDYYASSFDELFDVLSEWAAQA